MRKWIVGISAAGLLFSIASMASAQLRRNRTYQQPYQQGQFYEQQSGPQSQQGYGPQNQQGYGPQYQQGQQYQNYGRQPRVANRYDQGPVGQGPGISPTDRELASWLLVDNRAEIQLARMAQERASCDDVKDFAKKLIDDHSKIVEQLQQFAGMGRQQQFASNRGQPQSGGGLNLVRLKQQLGQQCLASSQRELEEKEGDEFDKCYIGMQLAMHMQMLDTLKVFSRYASQEFDEVIEQGEQVTQEHFDHAKELIKQLEKEDGSDKSSHHSSPSSNRSSRKDND